MVDAFVSGALCHPPLLLAVLQRSVEIVPAKLQDHAVFFDKGDLLSVLLPAPGQSADGGLLVGMTPDDIARLSFYSGFSGSKLDATRVEAGGGRQVSAWLANSGQWPDPTLWHLDDWVAGQGEVVTEAIRDAMALLGQKSAAEVRRRLPLMMVRAASRLRAGGGPTGLRRVTAPGDVRVGQHRQPYARFFSVEEYDLSFRRFDGTHSAEVNRAVFIGSDAVTVLPYDPVRDRVLLIEQFRVGPFARGDDQPWLLEPIAGRIDAGETPEGAARREALEEAGLVLGDLLKVAEYYPSPAAKAEYLYSYVALSDLPDGIAGTFGLADEAEDIRGHLISFDQLMQLVQVGEAANGPLILTALWLARERDRLRLL